MDDDAVYQARLALCDFLIEVFWDVPTEPFIEGLFEDKVSLPTDEKINEPLDEGFSLLASFCEDNRDRPANTVQNELKTEYTRVFVGPRPPVLAHETYYRDDTEFIGEGLAEVEESYSATGWNPPEDYGEENDFIAVELAFLRHLISRQRAGATEAFGYERVFLDEHLLQWAEDCAVNVREETDTRLYLAGASLFEGLVAFEDELTAQMT